MPIIDSMPDQTTQSPAPERGPAGWLDALLTMVASRSELIRIEAKDAARRSSQKAARVIAAILCIAFGWALLLAGTIAALAHFTQWPWFWIALAIGAIHILLAIILLRTSAGGSSPLFPVTRAEFQRDREWIEKLQKNPKSNA